MRMQGVVSLLAFAGAVGAVQGQTFNRQANIRGGGSPNEGKCTVEVVVDGAAQVQIRGASAQLINLKGQPAQWRRFECTGQMPPNPENFRFQGVDGRGSQQLVREPRNGAPAVIEINDPDNGAEGYTFDIFWGGRNVSDRGPGPGYYPQNGPYPPVQPGPGPAYRPGYDQRRGNFTVDQAVSICQDNIRQQVSERFRTNNVAFRETRIDDNPGRNDWVVGSVEVRSPYRGDQVMRFSCSVDFQTGRVRSATMDAGPGYPGRGVSEVNPRAIQNCERAARDKVAAQGFDRITLGTSRFDTDRGPRVVGDLRGYGRYGAESFRFSCGVDPRDGDVQSVDVFPRDDRQ